MTECYKEEFKALVKTRTTFSRLVGPFTHSAPSGNIFTEEPFKKYVWTIDGKTSLLKTWKPSSGWTYFKRELKIKG